MQGVQWGSPKWRPGMATLDSQSQIQTPNVSLRELLTSGNKTKQNKTKQTKHVFTVDQCRLSVDSFIDQAHGGVKQTGTAIDAASQYTTVATKA